MDIVVCLKQVPDSETQIQINNDQDIVEFSSAKWVMNPYDEIALEQAIQIKQQKPETIITVIRIGEEKSTEALRTGMAMGADRAILVEAQDNLDPITITKAIKNSMEKEALKPSLIFMGKQAIDYDSMQTPAILAEMINFAFVPDISSFEISDEDIIVKKECEGGTVETYKTKFPALFSCSKGLNNPRYPSLPGIMKAKRKPITKFTLSDLGIDETEAQFKYSNLRFPPKKNAGKKYDATDETSQQGIVEEIVSLLRNENKVI